MKKKTWVILITSVVILLIGVIATISHNSGIDFTNFYVSKDKKVEANDWKDIKVSKKGEIIKVVWDQKYGVRKTEYCKVVFENKKRKLYKLIASGLEIVIEQSNINDITFNTIPGDSIPK